MNNENSKPIAYNVSTCPICGGMVDRYDHLFQCRDCKAIGDLTTGLMSLGNRNKVIG